MAALPRDGQPAPLVDDGSSHLLLVVFETIRDNLHTLFLMSCLFLLAALPWVMLGSTTIWVLWWTPLVLTTAPLWTATVAIAQRMLEGDAVGWRTIGADLRRYWRPALTVGIPAAVCGTVLLGSMHVTSDPLWQGVVLPLTVGMMLAVGVLVIPAVPLMTRVNVAGLALWQASALIVVRRPGQVLGTAVLAGGGLGLAVAFGPAMLLGVAPLAVLIAAITLPDAD